MRYLKYSKSSCGIVICSSWVLIVWLSAVCYGQSDNKPSSVMRLSGKNSIPAKVLAAGEALSWKEGKGVGKKQPSGGTGAAYTSDSESAASSLLPIPRQVNLVGGEFNINKSWSV